MYRFRTLSVIFIAALILFSCKGSKKGDNVSSTTGWKYNDPDNGGFEVAIGAEQKTGPGLVLIEGGRFTMGRVEQDVMFDWNNIPRTVTVSSFYMDETEVRNVDYREYLFWIKRVYKDYPEVFRRALPDTLVWRSPMGFNDPYVQYYFRHPSYNNYPVVGVSWVKANDYCLWRTDRVNEQLLIDEGELNPDPNQLNEKNFNTEAYLAGQYEGVVNQLRESLNPNQTERRTNFEDGLLLPAYRLPTEAEWEFAAYALRGNTFEERVYERRIYPWDGHNVRNAAKKSRGEMMANFVRGRGDMMGVAGSLNDNGSITTDVKSYWPNDYGLYCMAGNVNEWVQDVYRPLTSQDVDGFQSLQGKRFHRPQEGCQRIRLLAKISSDVFISIPSRILMLQTGIITRRVITEITGMVIFHHRLSAVQTGHVDDRKTGLFKNVRSGRKGLSLPLSMIMLGYIRADHGETGPTGSILPPEGSLIRKAAVMISDSGVQ